MSDKTEKCKHSHSCLSNALRGLARGACYGFCIRATLVMIELLLKGRLAKDPWSLKKLFGTEVKRFTSFLGLLVFGYKGTLCTMRRYFDSERLNSFVAGSVSALPLALLDSKSMRTLIALYMLVRALEGLYKKSVERGWLPQLPSWLLYQFTYTTLNYGITFRVDAVNPSYLRMARYFMCTTDNERIMLDSFAKYYETIKLGR